MLYYASIVHTNKNQSDQRSSYLKHANKQTHSFKRQHDSTSFDVFVGIGASETFGKLLFQVISNIQNVHGDLVAVLFESVFR